jgi:hypothetical protein
MHILFAFAFAIAALMGADASAQVPSTTIIRARQGALPPAHPPMRPCQIRKAASRNPVTIPNC